MEAAQLELLRTDELDIALRLSFLEHSGGGAAGAGSSPDDKEARRKEKKKQKDLKVWALALDELPCFVCWWCPCACVGFDDDGAAGIKLLVAAKNVRSDWL